MSQPHRYHRKPGDCRQRNKYRVRGHHAGKQRQHTTEHTDRQRRQWHAVFVTRAKQAGSVRSFDNDHSMRPEAYNPEFAAEKAVRITKLKISAAYGIPTFSNTSTNGLFSTPACCIGISAASTNTVPIKKIISRAMVVRIATGITLRGFSVSPAAMPISSVPRKQSSLPP